MKARFFDTRKRVRGPYQTDGGLLKQTHKKFLGILEDFRNIISARYVNGTKTRSVCRVAWTRRGILGCGLVGDNADRGDYLGSPRFRNTICRDLYSFDGGGDDGGGRRWSGLHTNKNNQFSRSSGFHWGGTKRGDTGSQIERGILNGSLSRLSWHGSRTGRLKLTEV